MTIIYADITTPTADLRAAADAKSMTPTQFVAWATAKAVRKQLEKDKDNAISQRG
jgi:predicted RNA-binding protein associated with RNAse of E/G family